MAEEGTVEVRLRLTAEEAKRALEEYGDRVSQVGGATKKTQSELEKLGRTADDTSDTASRLAQALGTVSPEAQTLFTIIADLADGFRGATEIAEGFGIKLSTVALGGGAAVAVLGGLSLGFVTVSRDIENARIKTEALHDANQSLLPTINALRDAELDLAVATGRLTDAQADDIAARNKAGDSVKALAEAQRSQRLELRQGIDTADTWLAAIQGAEGIVDPLGVGRLIRSAAGFGDAYTMAADVVGGFSDTIETNKSVLETLDNAVESEAENQKKLRDVVLDTNDALDAQAKAAKGASVALQEWHYNFNPGAILAALDEASAQNRVFAAPAPTPYPYTTGGSQATMDEASASSRIFSRGELWNPGPIPAEAWTSALSSIASGSVSGLLSSLGPVGAAAGAGFDVVSGFADKNNSVTDQLTEGLVNFGDGLGNLGSELVEFVTKGLFQDAIPALLEGALKIGPSLVKTLVTTLFSKDFWMDVGAAFAEAIVDAFNPFNGSTGAGTIRGAEGSRTDRLYQGIQSGDIRSRSPAGQTSRMAADTGGITFRVGWADWERSQSDRTKRGEFR